MIFLIVSTTKNINWCGKAYSTNKAYDEEISGWFLFFITCSTAAVTFQTLPGVAYFLVHTFCNSKRSFLTTLRRQLSLSCSWISCQCKCAKHGYCWFCSRCVYNELEHHHFYFAYETHKISCDNSATFFKVLYQQCSASFVLSYFLFCLFHQLQLKPWIA